MNKIGLALSGGGFRATVYHLGVIRFLHDAGILSRVTHITSVSGGSIIAAHLVLNWNRYKGSDEEFEAAASELLSFVRLDVRNRLLRRFLLALPLRWPRKLLGFSNRKLTRTGLLEYHYEKYLYGEASLFELPENPALHILSTNVSEGRLCSFNREGLLSVRRQRDGAVHIDQIHVGLATVAMAVTASSAFPGFFPPLELTGADVGAKGGEFGRQAYTDGGVFDNLGVRMFRFLKGQLQAEHSLDGVLVSDVGKPIEVLGNRQSGGLIKTAVRATDIVMDRVWQLELETFHDTPGFVFAPITEVVEPSEDPTALHPEIQRQVANIRTDMDRFSLLEISSLVRHGYCVGRKACRSRPDLFGEQLPNNSPWDPIPGPGETGAPAAMRPSGLQSSLMGGIGAGVKREPSTAAANARKLQASAFRRVWSTLLDYRDWTSYIYVPILIPILTVLPYFAVRFYQRSHRLNQLVESLSQSSPDLERMSGLLEGQVKPWTGEVAEEIPNIEEVDNKEFEILQDSHIFDLRNSLFRIRLLPTSPLTKVLFPQQRLQPRLRMASIPGGERCFWEAIVNFREVPAGEFVEVLYEHLSPGDFLKQNDGSTTLTFETQAETAELTRWLLMPQGREYKSFGVVRYEKGKPEKAEAVQLVTEYLAEDYTILAFKLLSLKRGYIYELTWFYK
jgi:predicted acylesterase/phospholipase RssA